ncbi:hypothetical protein [Flavisericum labens]|uniref:hypothetical protein n=1 Tax=Flavisericum labens TaxID=3377112 RepID=UPI00387AE64C
MKRLLHIVSIIASIVFVYNIFQILSLGISNLSNFGFGALIGKVLLLLASLFVALKTRKQKKEE